jgi:periplasmic protein TonB
MNTSVFRKPVGALWPNEALHEGRNNAMAIAIAAALAIEVALVASVSSVHAPKPAPRPAPVMQIRFAKVDTPPPPPPPPPQIVKKVLKHESELPAPTHTVRSLPKPHPVPAPVTPTPVATQDAPAPTQAVPSPAPAAPSTTEAGPTTAATADPPDVAIVCPVQAKPEMPPRALAEGITGSVTARATIHGGKVIHVDIVESTPPGVFDGVVRRAMSQYQCKVDGGDDVIVEQSFDFANAD